MDDDTRQVIISLPMKLYRHARRLLDFAASDPDTEALRRILLLGRRTLDAVSDTACEKCGGLLTPGQMLDGWTIHPDCRPDDEKRLGRVMASIARKQGHDHATIRALTDTLEYEAGQLTGPAGLDEVYYRRTDKVDGQLMETALMLVTGAVAAPMDALHRTVDLPVSGAEYLRIEEVKIGDIYVTVLEWRGKPLPYDRDVNVGDRVTLGGRSLFVAEKNACDIDRMLILAVAAEDTIPF